MSQFLGAGVVSLSALCMPGGIFLRALRPFRSGCGPSIRVVIRQLSDIYLSVGPLAENESIGGFQGTAVARPDYACTPFRSPA